MSTIPKAAVLTLGGALITAGALTGAGLPVGLIALGIKGLKKGSESVASDHVKELIAKSKLEAEAKKKAAAQIGLPDDGQPNIGQEVDSVA